MKLLIAVLGVVLFSIKQGYAVPSFARNLKVSCKECHTTYPHLNAYGRKFKSTLGAALKQDTFQDLSLSSNPFSARLKLRIFDKTYSQTKTGANVDADQVTKIRSLHEGEIFMAGRTGKIYYIGELESEDEWTSGGGAAKGFDVRFTEGYAGYNISNSFNILAGFHNPLVFDTAGTANHHNIMRNNWGAASLMPGEAQFIGIGGVVNNLTYILSHHGAEADQTTVSTEGKDPQNWIGRLSYAFGEHSVGLTYGMGRAWDSNFDESVGYSYTNLAFDLSLDFHGFEFRLMYASNDNDSFTRGTKKKDTTTSIEMYKSFGKWTPILGVDLISENKSATLKEDKKNAQVALLYALGPNARASINYENTFGAESKYIHKYSRLALRTEFAF